MPTDPTPTKPAKPLDKRDLAVLVRVANGERFLAHISHWNRACDLADAGYLKSEMAVWKWTHGGERAEYRKRFALTAKGSRALEDTANV